jgi:hypothetical protein
MSGHWLVPIGVQLIQADAVTGIAIRGSATAHLNITSSDNSAAWHAASRLVSGNGCDLSGPVFELSVPCYAPERTSSRVAAD